MKETPQDLMIPDLLEIFMYCPRCESDGLEAISFTYPRAFECKSCKCFFMDLPKMLIDE